MGIFNKEEKANQKYAQVKEQTRLSAISQAEERQIDIPTEPLSIGEMTNLPAKREYLDYIDITNFILSEYPTELGFYVATAFTNFAQELGYDPFGKIMIATQYVDEMAGSQVMFRASFIDKHPKFYEFLTQKHCPERTTKSLDFLTTGVFQFQNANFARVSFPKMFPVPEIKTGVRERLHQIDEDLGRYIAG